MSLNKNAALNKRKYLSEAAPQSIKNFSKIGLIFTLVTLIFIVSCYVNFANKSIEKIPLLSKSDVNSSELESACEGLDIIIDEALDKADLSKKEERALKKLEKATEKLSNKVSLNTIKNFVKTCSNIGEGIGEEADTEIEAIEEVYFAIKLVSTLILCLFVLLCAPFTLLGGLFRINILVVLGMLLTTILTAILCGWLFVILSLVLHIVIIVCNSRVKSAFKKYKSSLK